MSPSPLYSNVEAGGKPSTWFPPEKLVELRTSSNSPPRKDATNRLKKHVTDEKNTNNLKYNKHEPYD